MWYNKSAHVYGKRSNDIIDRSFRCGRFLCSSKFGPSQVEIKRYPVTLFIYLFIFGKIYDLTRSVAFLYLYLK